MKENINIVHLQGDKAIMSNGSSIQRSTIKTSYRVGDTLSWDGDGWARGASLVDESCLNGLCSLPLPDNKRG